MTERVWWENREIDLHILGFQTTVKALTSRVLASDRASEHTLVPKLEKLITELDYAVANNMNAAPGILDSLRLLFNIQGSASTIFCRLLQTMRRLSMISMKK